MNSARFVYGNCKVHKQQVDGCPLLWPILSVLQTPTYNLVKFLFPTLNPLIKNEYTVWDSFPFAEEICEQYPKSSIGSLDVDPLFANIPLDETIDICFNQLFKHTDAVEGFIKSELKQLLCFTTKEFYILYSMVYSSQTNWWCSNGLTSWTFPFTNFCHTTKKTGNTIVHKDLSQFFIDVMLMIFSYSSNPMIT